MTLGNVVNFIIRQRQAITDRQLTEAIFGDDQRHTDINQECRLSEAQGIIQRIKEGDGPIMNVPMNLD